jgi:hypothetical protein
VERTILELLGAHNETKEVHSKLDMGEQSKLLDTRTLGSDLSTSVYRYNHIELTMKQDTAIMESSFPRPLQLLSQPDIMKELSVV